MSRSATPATRNEATTRLKPPKMTTSAELPIGTAIRSSYERLRTVADADATSSEHTFNPQTPRVKREPLLRIREKLYIYILYIHVHFPSSPGKEDLPFWPQDASSLGVQSPVDLQIRRSNGQIQFFGSPKKNEKRRPLFYTFLYFIIHFSILFYTLSLTFLYFSIYSAMTIHILATICSEQNAALEDTPTRRQHKYTVLVSLWIISDMEVS